MGREGCGADCQVRELEGGVRVARGVSLWVGAVVVGEDIVEGREGGLVATGGRRLRWVVGWFNWDANVVVP